MEGNCGKYYYATNPDSTPELVRLERVIGHDDESHHSICVVRRSGTILRLDWLASHLKSNYASIAPQLNAYFVSFKDAPLEDSLWMVLEPYNSGEDDPIDPRATAISVLRLLVYKGPGISVTFEHHKHKDVLDYARDMKGYMDADVGGVWHAYYKDDALETVANAYRLYTVPRGVYASICGWRNDYERIVKTKRLSAEEVRGFESGLVMLGDVVRDAIDTMLNILWLEPEDADALKAFTKDRTLTEEAKVALLKTVNYEDKGTASWDAVDDPILQSSILTFDLTLKTDLSKVKSDNPLYTLVVARAKKRKPLVILYRRKPVEFRTSEQTGFTQQEMAKLLT